MIEETVLEKVTALCRKYCEPYTKNKEVIIGGQDEDQVSVRQIEIDLTRLAGDLRMSVNNVFPTIARYIAYLQSTDTKCLARADYVKMLVDGMPGLSQAYQEKQFVIIYGNELADHVDFDKVSRLDN